MIGNRGKIEVNPRDMMVKGLTVHGVMLFNQTVLLISLFELRANNVKMHFSCSIPLRKSVQS